MSTLEAIVSSLQKAKEEVHKELDKIEVQIEDWTLLLVNVEKALLVLQ